ATLHFRHSFPTRLSSDLSIMWGRLTGTLLRDTATGRAIGMLEDITERRELEQERARLTAVVNATTDFVGTARVDGRIMTLNAAARRMLGIGEAEVVEGLEVKDMHPPREYARIRNEGIPVAIRDGAWSGETVIAARDGRE